MKKYIQNSSNAFLNNKETVFYKSKPVFIVTPLPKTVSLKDVLSTVEKIIPRHLVYNIDALYIGNFETFKKRQTNAAYEDGALYVSSDQDDIEDMVDDIVHEIAHAAEEKYWAEIYGDGLVEKEFISKRKRLFDILRSHEYNVREGDFLNTEYSENFDMLLYKQIGYEKLEFFSMSLFLTPYSITSLQEYYAIGFEEHFLRDRGELISVSPYLARKIEILNQLET